MAIRKVARLGHPVLRQKCRDLSPDEIRSAPVRQLVAEGCDVATCDIIQENLDATLELCRAEAPQGVRVTGLLCDVADEDQVNAFRPEPN